MNLHDPSRPRNDRGALLLILVPCIVPVLSFVPRALGGWYLYINVPVGYNEFKQWSMTVEDSRLVHDLINSYENDPEDFLIKMCDMPTEFKQKELTTQVAKTSVSEGKKAVVEEIEF